MQVHAKPISIAEARRRILATVSDAARDARAALQVDLADAAGYVLAEEILADRDAPPFNRAMMDGYALNSADFAARSPGFGYRVVGETIFAGTMPIEIVTPGGCRRIMTGAPLPPGADCVIPVEDALAESLAGALEDFVEKSAEKSAPGEYARAEPGSVSFPGVTDPAAIREHRFVAPRGGDLRAGQSVLKAGAPLDGAAMNVLASLGRARVSVRPPPRVVMLSTGDEIVPVESPEIRPEQIRDSNYYALCAGLAAYRVERPAHRIVPDDRDILTAAVAAALDADLLILSGGVSMGDADFVPGVLQAAGIETIFHRVNVKPGKPL
ncbi:MAG: molybdopterin molybdotransferase MoeA, partial [Leptospirales bacterium]